MKQLNLNTIKQVTGGYAIAESFTDNNGNIIALVQIMDNGSLEDFASCANECEHTFWNSNQIKNFSATLGNCSYRVQINNNDTLNFVKNRSTTSSYFNGTSNANWTIN